MYIKLTKFVALCSMLSSTSAYTGKASWDSLGTTPCPKACPLTDYRVALPVTLFPDGQNCCSQVIVQYQNKQVTATFTDLFLAGANSYNISLSHQAFAELSQLEVGTIDPVTWNLK